MTLIFRGHCSAVISTGFTWQFKQRLKYHYAQQEVSAGRSGFKVTCFYINLTFTLLELMLG